jgi:hypothetical protein
MGGKLKPSRNLRAGRHDPLEKQIALSDALRSGPLKAVAEEHDDIGSEDEELVLGRTTRKKKAPKKEGAKTKASHVVHGEKEFVDPRMTQKILQQAREQQAQAEQQLRQRQHLAAEQQRMAVEQQRELVAQADLQRKQAAAQRNAWGTSAAKPQSFDQIQKSAKSEPKPQQTKASSSSAKSAPAARAWGTGGRSAPKAAKTMEEILAEETERAQVIAAVREAEDREAAASDTVGGRAGTSLFFSFLSLFSVGVLLTPFSFIALLLSLSHTHTVQACGDARDKPARLVRRKISTPSSVKRRKLRGVANQRARGR